MLPTNRCLVLEPQAVQLLSQYGIPYPEHALAQSADQAAQLAERLGFPVVLKVVSPDVVHKSDAGGVLVDLQDAKQVTQGYQQIVDAIHTRVLGARIDGVLVCRQAEPGMEVIVGALDDSVFGPTVMFGMGGIFAEVLGDVAFRLAPLDRDEARKMIREVKGHPLLAGVRGQPPRDEEALLDLLMAVSQVVVDHREIKELDLNPVRLYEEGLLVLDARTIVTGG
jgi:acyl-CoA synthetase (NDP forming)